MDMDRSWMFAKRISEQYENGVEVFIEFPKKNDKTASDEKFRCLCINCLNEVRQIVDQMRELLLCDDIIKSYTTWTWHGERLNIPTHFVPKIEIDEVCMEDRLEDMIRDVGVEFFS